MKRFQLQYNHRKILADTVTPVSAYLSLRDHFSTSLLLESSDYHGTENSYSYICFDPLSSFKASGRQVTIEYPDGSEQQRDLTKPGEILQQLKDYAGLFQTASDKHKCISNGLFGYMSYDAVTYFEDIKFDDHKKGETEIPEILYSIYRFTVVVDHFSNELHVFEHYTDQDPPQSEYSIDRIVQLIKSRRYPSYFFKTSGQEQSNVTDQEYIEMVKKGIQHCLRGDVIQIVLSRLFKTSFHGDEFNVYRVLRSINPSPYLFYFDYGNYKIWFFWGIGILFQALGTFGLPLFLSKDWEERKIKEYLNEENRK